MSNMIANGVLDIIDLNTGNTIKFGDKTPLKYQLIDSNNEELDIKGMLVDVVIISDELDNKATIAQSVVESGNIVKFTVENNYKNGFYFLEFVVDGKYIFPSEHKAGFRITKSSLSIESEIIKMDSSEDIIERLKKEVSKGETFVHEQEFSSDTWEIKHLLNKYPSVTIVDSADTEVVGDVSYLGKNIIKIVFSAPFSGKAYLN